MDTSDKLLFLSEEIEIMKEALQHDNLQYAEILHQLNENLEIMNTKCDKCETICDKVEYNKTLEENTRKLTDQKEKAIKELEGKKTLIQGLEQIELVDVALKDIEQKITSTNIKKETFIKHLLEEKEKLDTQEAIDELSEKISSLEEIYDKVLNDLQQQSVELAQTNTYEEVLAYVVSNLDRTIAGINELHSRAVTDFDIKRDRHFAKITSARHDIANVTPVGSDVTLPAPCSDKERRLTMEIENVEKNIEDVNKMTSDAIASLEEQKRQLKEQHDPNMTESQIELDIEDIKGQHEKIITALGEKYGDATQKKISIDLLDQAVADMDREISRIQHEHDNLILQLVQKKQMLGERLSSIEKLDLLINVLTYKIYEAQHDYRKDMDELMKQREKLLARTDLTESQLNLALAELDKLIADRENMHEAYLLSLQGQRAELRQESECKMKNLDLAIGNLRKEYEDMVATLEARKIGATPSELEEINRQIAELNAKFKREMDDLIKLKQSGWNELNSEEKLLQLLEQRGLRITKSGRILTGSGRLLSQSEAQCLGLLDGLETRFDKLVAQRADIKVESDESSTVTLESSSEGSLEIQMSSEDVSYLKTVVGKPLALALAEIIAKQPKDPIHYLSHWLYRYRYNQEADITRKRELKELMDERERIAKEKWHKILEEEARAAVLEMIMRAEEEAMRREIERELARIARQAVLGEEEGERSALDDEARDVLGIYGGPPTKANLYRG